MFYTTRHGDQKYYTVIPTVSGLNFRKIDIKLMIAYMATADMELRDANPGIMSSYDQDDLFYARMWEKIHSYNKAQGFADMSDRAVRKIYMERLAKDKSLAKTVDQWEQFGWTEHEHLRHERNGKATRWGVRGAFIGLALLGISLPEVEA